MDNKCTYEGSFTAGMLHGKGLFTWPNGVTFDGDFELGQICGAGVYTWPDGSTYTGGVKEGKRHGEGVFRCSSGQLYEGGWDSSLRSGSGTLWYNAEKTIYYTGEWLLGMRHGYGYMRYVSGNSYEGEWIQDKKSGRGVMLWRDVDEVYLGDWLNNAPHGEGEHIWGTGEPRSLQKQICNVYRGEWFNGLRNGRGSFFYSNGSQYTGQWKGNKKHGAGVLMHYDGHITFAAFSDDQLLLSESSPVPVRETEDVNPQVRLNLSDIYAMYPPAGNGSNGSNTASVNNSSSNGSASVTQSLGSDNRTKELERLLLRYNSCILSLYRTYANAANKLRIADPETAPKKWRKIDQVLHTARNFHQRLSTMTLEQMCRCMRECSIIGPYFSSYDVAKCLHGMRRQFSDVAVTQQRIVLQQSGYSLGSGYTPVSLEPLLDQSVDADVELDMRQPILQREFCEMLIRCIASATCRRGVTKNLYDTVFKVMATSVQPIEADPKLIPGFVHALYHDHVQALLRDFRPALKTIWAQVVEAAARDGFTHNTRGMVQLRHVIRVVLTFKGTTLDDETTLSTLLEIFGKGVNAMGDVDVTCLSMIIIYDDFIELICKLVLSEAWIDASPDDVSVQSEQSQETKQTNESGTHHASLKGEVKVLTARLSTWLTAQ